MAARTVEIAFIGSTADLEAALARAGISADVAGKTISDAFNKSTSAAGGALTNLANKGASIGLPLSGSLAKIGTALDQATTKTSKLTTVFSALGKVAVVGGLAAFGVAAFEGVKGAAALQQQMELLHTQAGATQTQVTSLTKSILGMAASVGTSPQTLAEGMYHVVSSLNATLPAATRASTELKVLQTAAQGAKVGNADLVDVTNALDAAVVSGIGGVQNYQQAMGALNATVGAGDMTMQNLADALSTGLLGPMKTYGLTITEVGGALAVLGDNNIRGQEAATKLTSAIRIMAAPSNAAATALGQVGLKALQLATDMRQGGIVQALSDLKQHLIDSGDTATQQGLVITRAFGGRQSTGVQVLLQQLDRLKAKTADVAAGAGSFASDWTATTKNLSFEWSQITAGVVAFADKLGGVLLPKIQELGEFIANNKGHFEDLAKVIGVVLAGAIATFAEQKVALFVGGINKMVVAAQAMALKWTATSAGIVAEDGTLVASETAVSAGAAGMATAFAAASVSMVASLATVAAPLAALVVGFKAYEDLKNNAGTWTGPGTGNLQQAEKTIQSQSGGILSPSQALQMAKAEVSQFDLNKAPTSNSFSLANTGNNLFGTQIPQSASGGGSVTAGGVSPVPAGLSSSSTAITPAEAQLEVVAKTFMGMLSRANAGGTSFSQQGRTLRGLSAATSGTNAAQESSLVNSLNASNNPTLTGLAQSIETTWQNATTKMATIIDSDTTKGQSELQKLQSAQQSTTIHAILDATDSAAKAGYTQLVSELKSTHQAALSGLVKQLEANWRETMSALKQINAALATETQANTIANQAAIVGIQTQAAQQSGSAAVQVSGLGSQQTADQLNAAATAIQDAAKIQTDQAQAQTTAITDAMNIASAAATAQATQIKDAATLLTDAATLMVDSINAQTTAMQDTSNAQVTAIQDQTQTQVDTLAERGLYGLNLVAQQDKVAIDIQKQTDDVAIAAAQAHLDQVTAFTNQQVAIAQQRSDSDLAVGDAQVAQAQMAALMGQQANDAAVAQATAALDVVQQQADAEIAQAQAQADTVQITSAIADANAEAAAAAAALQAQSLTAQAQQLSTQSQFEVGAASTTDAAQAQLLQAQASAITAAAASTVQAIQNQTSLADQAASNALQQAQATASQQEAAAQAALAQAQSAASTSSAQQQATLTAIQNAVATQAAQDAANLAAAQASASISQAQAQQQLATVQTTAEVTEAKLTSIYNIQAELAATQFAGGGTVINLYGVPLDNAAEITNQIDWSQRTSVPAAVGS